jgi:hypothetical protein
VYAIIQINPLLPPDLNESYEPFGYFNLGICAWVYAPQGQNSAAGGFRARHEFINSLLFYSEPPYPNPVAFDYYLKPGVQGIVTVEIQVRSDIPDVVINDVAYNAATGKNMAAFLSELP